MLNINSYKRPNIHSVLQESIVQGRIQNFLTKTVLNNEFSHTIFHKQEVISKDGRINKLEIQFDDKAKPKAIESRRSEDRKPVSIKPVCLNYPFPKKFLTYNILAAGCFEPKQAKITAFQKLTSCYKPAKKQQLPLQKQGWWVPGWFQ